MVAPGGGYQYQLADTAHGGHITNDALNQNDDNRYDPLYDADNVWGNGTAGDRASAAADAHFGAAATYNYFRDAHGRYGTDGTGLMPNSHVHAGTPGSERAVQGFWRGACACATYGDGNGVTTAMVSLDIVGHEMTHAVVASSARLGSTGEPDALDALDESIADVFGTLIEFATRTRRAAHGAAHAAGGCQGRAAGPVRAQSELTHRG